MENKTQLGVRKDKVRVLLVDDHGGWAGAGWGNLPEQPDEEPDRAAIRW